jgi:tRNA-uridine 2-sulfurtransferase
MPTFPSVIVALSGGVDSAVSALLLRDAGYAVQCLHMTNWEDDDGYCEAARDYQDAYTVSRQLGLPLHRVNFAREYRDRVFARFLDEHRAGRTPNPDVLCNREIKFGMLRAYARRLGAALLATGHYARLDSAGGPPRLLKARDRSKDQSYFLHAVRGEDFAGVLFPLGERLKSEVRALAHAAGIAVSDKKDSTGICFIGERPFAEFLGRYLPPRPGPIRTAEGTLLGTHCGLAFYTLGQRHGLHLGGRKNFDGAPWYVAAKRADDNTLVVVQRRDHPLLMQNWLRATDMHWIGEAPSHWHSRGTLACTAKTRYRQPDAACTVRRVGTAEIELDFAVPQRAITPGQYVVLYDGDHCLGGATIAYAALRETVPEGAVQTA